MQNFTPLLTANKPILSWSSDDTDASNPPNHRKSPNFFSFSQLKHRNGITCKVLLFRRFISSLVNGQIIRKIREN